jgi:hypothetical protein
VAAAHFFCVGFALFVALAGQVAALAALLQGHGMALVSELLTITLAGALVGLSFLAYGVVVDGGQGGDDRENREGE